MQHLDFQGRGENDAAVRRGLLVLGLGLSICGAVLGAAKAVTIPTHPYHLQATRGCLVAHHVRVKTLGPTQIGPLAGDVGMLEWRFPGGSISVPFGINPAGAAGIRHGLALVHQAEGATPAQIQRGLLRFGNAVINPSTFSSTVDKPSRVATIKHCLR